MVARNRITLSGTLGNGAEDWSVSFHSQLVGGGAVTDSAALTTWAGVILGAFSGNTALMNRTGTGSVLGECTVYAYGTSGPAIASGSATGGAGGTGTVAAPPQTAMTISLLTGSPGARNRGRVYWPCLVATVQSDLRVSSATCLQVAEAFRNAAATAMAATQEDSELCVYSPT